MFRWLILLAATLVALGAPPVSAAEGQATAEPSVRTPASEAQVTEVDDLDLEDLSHCPERLWIGPQETDLPARSESGGCIQRPVDLCVYEAHTKRQANRCLRQVSRHLLGKARALPNAEVACRSEASAPNVEATTILEGLERAQPIFCRIRDPRPRRPAGACECRVSNFRAVPGDAGRADVLHGLLAELDLWRPVTLRVRAEVDTRVDLSGRMYFDNVRFGYKGREILGGVPNDYVLGDEIELFRSSSKADVGVDLPIAEVTSRVHCRDHTLEAALPSGEGRATVTLRLPELTERLTVAIEQRLSSPREIREYGKRYLVTGVHSVAIEQQTVYRVVLWAICAPRSWGFNSRIRQEAVPGGYRLRVP